jgi:peroxiredoxin
MKMSFFSILLSFSISTLAATNGEMAPSFSLEGSPDQVKLADQKGKYVVLEWYNDGCPFVRKHYDSNNMQALQEKYKGKVSWLTINSSAKNRQGYLSDSSAAKSMYTKEQMKAMSLLLDPSGKVGKAYGAKTTPHMFIIDPAGKIAYQGAIDSISSANPDDAKKAKNYVDMALTSALAGRKIAMAKTQPYGCSVKY